MRMRGGRSASARLVGVGEGGDGLALGGLVGGREGDDDHAVELRGLRRRRGRRRRHRHLRSRSRRRSGGAGSEAAGRAGHRGQVRRKLAGERGDGFGELGGL